MPSFRFVILLLCSSQIFCATIPDESESPSLINELAGDEEVSTVGMDDEDEVSDVTVKMVPSVRMPPSADAENEEDVSVSKLPLKSQAFYSGQIEIWPKKMTNPEYDLLDMKAFCHEDELMVSMAFSAPFNGFIYPYHYFKRCSIFNGDGKTEMNLMVDKNACGLDVVYESPKGDIKFMSFTLMVQWNRNFMGPWDRKVRITCNHKDNENVLLSLNDTHDNSTFEAEIRMDLETETEDESDDDSSALTSAYDHVQVGENIDITFSVKDRNSKEDVDAQVVECKAVDDLRPGEMQTINTYTSDESKSEFSYDGSFALMTDGCSKDSTVFSEFQKEKKTFAVSLNNRFKVFRFPSSPFLFVTCNVRVCRGECPPQQDCNSKLKTALDDSSDHKIVRLFRSLMVRSPMGGGPSADEHHGGPGGKTAVREGVPTASFIAGLIGMGFVCAIVCVFMYRRFKKGTEKDYKMQYSPNAEKNKDEVAPLKVTSASTD